MVALKDGRVMPSPRPYAVQCVCVIAAAAIATGVAAVYRVIELRDDRGLR